MTKFLSFCIPAVVAASMTTGTASGATISFQEGVSPSGSYVADSTYIRNDGAGPNSKNDDDGDDENIVGFNSAATAQLRALYEFDLSAISGPVVANSVNLVQTSRGDMGSDFTLALYQYGSDFVEADATWNDPDGDGNAGTGDTTAGGTTGTFLSSLAYDVSAVSLGDDVTISDTAAFRTAVQSAIDSATPLRLILVPEDHPGGQGFARFYDETFGTLGDRPELIVTFSPIPEPSTFTFSTLGLLSLGFVGWRRRQR